MSELNKLYTASFKGISFLEIEDEKEAGGIKYVKHEYPLSNRRSIESLGLQLPDFTVKCMFRGENYRNDRDRFRQAITDGESGILTSQFKGKQNVKALSYELEESTDSIGSCTFTVKLSVESQSGAIAPREVAKTQRIVEDQKEVITTQIESDFVEGYEVPDNPVELDSMLDKMNSFSSEISAAAQVFTPALDNIFALESALNNFQSSLSSLISAPLELASAVTGLIEKTRNILDLPLDQLGQLESMLGFGSDDHESKNDTINQNRAASNALIQTQALSLSYESIMRVDFDSADETQEKQDKLDIALSGLEKGIGAYDFDAGVTLIITTSTHKELITQRTNTVELINQDKGDLLNTIIVNTTLMSLSRLVYTYTGSLDTITAVRRINGIVGGIVEGEVKLLVRSV